MPQRILVRLAAVALTLTLAIPQAAAEQHYSTWADPAAADARTDRAQDMIEKLNALIDEAEKARAADPRFLRDLRDLARGFDRPWRKLVFSDDFNDGDFTTGTPWSVTNGRYWVDRGWGLRSMVTAATQAAAPAKQKKPSGRDVAAALFGQFLKQATNPDGGGTAAADSPAEPAFAAIHTAAAITNAFSVELELSSWKGQGRLEIGPYQGAARASGYRLAYTAGTGLELLRVSGRGTSVVERTTGPLALEDKKTHLVQWNRHRDGRMTVAVDGKEVLAVNDRGFRDPFDGFTVINRGGDFIVRRIAVYGTP